MSMRKLTSLIGALLISVGFSSSALATDYSTVSAAKNPVPPSPVSLEKAEPSGFTLLRDGGIKMGGGKTAALTPLRKKSAYRPSEPRLNGAESSPRRGISTKRRRIITLLSFRS